MKSPRRIKNVISDLEKASNGKELLKILGGVADLAEREYARVLESNEYVDAVQECKIASEAFSRAVELVVENPSKYPEVKPTLLGYFRETSREWERKSETVARDGLEKYRKDAHVLQENKRYYEAIDTLNKALKIDPKNSVVLYDMGLMLNNLGDSEGALDRFEKAIQADPKFEQAYLAKGEVAFKTEQYPIAKDAYSKAVELNNSSAWAWNGLGATLCEGESDFEHAREAIEKALEIKPDSILYKANLAEVMLLLDNYAKSEELASWVRDNASDEYNSFAMRLLLVLSPYLRHDPEKGIEAAADIVKYSRTVSRFSEEENWDFSHLSEKVSQSDLAPEVKEALLFFTRIPKLSEDQLAAGFDDIEKKIAAKTAPKSVAPHPLMRLWARTPKKIRAVVVKERIGDRDIKIANTATPDPDKPGYYDWAIFVDAPMGVLSQIMSVKYILHPSYIEREIFKENRGERFKLEQNGWGEFNVKVEIALKDGRTLTKYHRLKLAGFTSSTSAELS